MVPASPVKAAAAGGSENDEKQFACVGLAGLSAKLSRTLTSNPPQPQ